MMKTRHLAFARYAGWLLLGVILILAASGVILQYNTGSRIIGGGPPVIEDIFTVLAMGVWALVGALLISLQPQNPFGWIFSLTALISVMDQFAFGYAYYGYVAHPGSLPGVEMMILWLTWGSRVAILFPITLLLILFPTGRPLSPGWGRLIWLSALATILAVLASMIAPLPNTNFPFPLAFEQPDSTTLIVIRSVAWAAFALLYFCAGAASVSLFIRLTRASGVERQQIKWFVLIVTLSLPAPILTALGLIFETPFLFRIGIWFLIAFIAGIPIASFLAIVRYRLWDIDIIIRRTLVYSLVTLVLALIYFGSVIVLQWLFTAVTNQESPLAIVISTLLIAALFNPLRHRVQKGIDRRFYRQKYDAQQVLAQFAQTARDETDIEMLSVELVHVVEETLQPTFLEIWLKNEPG